MRDSNASIASRRNAIDNSSRECDWNKLENIMYRSNSINRNKKPQVRRRVAQSILPSKDELIFDILIPTIKRSIIERIMI